MLQRAQHESMEVVYPSASACLLTEQLILLTVVQKMRTIFGSIREVTSPIPFKGGGKELGGRKYFPHERHAQKDIAGIVKQFEGLL